MKESEGVGEGGASGAPEAVARPWIPWATLAAVAAILFLRKPEALLRPEFWYEDGSVFFADARERGIGSLFVPYAGYLHFFPRLVAWLATAFPVVAAPALYNGAALLAVLGVCALLFHPRLDLPWRPLLALCVALAPDAWTSFLNLTHAQWYLSLLLVLLCRKGAPETAAGAALDLAVLAIVGLTGPFSIFAFPMFALRWAAAIDVRTRVRRADEDLRDICGDGRIG